MLELEIQNACFVSANTKMDIFPGFMTRSPRNRCGQKYHPFFVPRLLRRVARPHPVVHDDALVVGVTLVLALVPLGADLVQALLLVREHHRVHGLEETQQAAKNRYLSFSRVSPVVPGCFCFLCGSASPVGPKRAGMKLWHSSRSLKGKVRSI